MTDPVPSPARESPPAAPRPRRRWWTIGLGAAGYLAFAALLALTAADGSLHRSEVITEAERHPATVDYGDDSTYYIGLIHERSAVFGRHLGYRLYTGRHPGMGYGHFVRLDLGIFGARPEIQTAHWDDKGVRVTFTSGHEVFVPARYYTGGR